MSYESNQCPCGGRKERETMLCQACLDHMAERHPFELRHWQDPNERMETRRSSAIRLLAAARRRKSSREFPLTYRL